MMPSVFTSRLAARGADDALSPAACFTRALVGLTRSIWHPDCTFDTAIGLICETAAAALQVDRVNVWHYDRSAHELRCIHTYFAPDDDHASGGRHGDVVA